MLGDQLVSTNQEIFVIDHGSQFCRNGPRELILGKIDRSFPI
jgi:hypothetical protein